MRIIGITGGIGTGKSTLLHLIKENYNAYIVETDTLAHSMMMPGEPVYEQIVSAFGTEILSEDGTIDRGSLGMLVFNSEEALKRLNGIVHPAVKEYIIKDIGKKNTEGETVFYIIEAALLIEDGYKAICDELWYVYVKKEERIRRLLAGRGGNPEKWERVIANQSSDTYYREHCDVVIDNGGDLEKTANIIKGLLSKST